MKKEKYVIMVDNKEFYLSNSRNARKHLIESGARTVSVYSNDDKYELLCCARWRANRQFIMVGAKPNK